MQQAAPQSARENFNGDAQPLARSAETSANSGSLTSSVPFTPSRVSSVHPITFPRDRTKQQ